ncbi:hypothetical protein SAMN06265795_12638 [Noviherbaspirillum humi]|uniref:Phage antitermination protein Q n=1 Tax=Noviherbaspirillum humi TaxID=1688639 RepID=A0A239LTR1_9BURK|nr:hypothetical protein [Noviherbaspirillum humi]SNT33660.1 hypothetical protein SAMN06265795_12638 [Noviherbaspirillum humi]
MTRILTITDRLENWGRWARSWSRRAEGDCLTAVICERLRKATNGILPGADGPLVNETDALQVDRAWRLQQDRHKSLLRWLYVRNASPDFICRRLHIPIRPVDFFDIELGRAVEALQNTLDKNQQGNRIRSSKQFDSVMKHDET